MEMIETQVRLADASGVGTARRRVDQMARTAGFDDTDAGRAALIVTEAAGNAVKHGGGGECLLRAERDERGASVEVVVLDSGPGIANVAQASRDGFSSAGTPGTGLGAIARTASAHDIYSRTGQGTVVYAAVWPTGTPARGGASLIGAVTVPHPAETVCGDDWAMMEAGGRSLALVADGLGHGPEAHTAARAAREAFLAAPAEPALEILERIHLALRPTRGAAVAVAEIDRGRGSLRFAGLGNISGTVVTDGKTRSLVSLHGTAGHDARRLRDFTSSWAASDVLVMHSDGIATRWALDAYPGLLERHPVLAAAVLYRDFRRGRDDATILVVRNAA